MKILACVSKDTKTFDRSFQNCTTSCHAYLALREDYRQQLRQVQKEIGFNYIRFHGIFCDEVGIYNEDKEGNPYFNFQNIDKIYDFLLETGIKPFVEFSFMPEQLASGTKTCFKYKGNVMPPKDYNKWNDLIRATVLHCIERYGLQEVITWRFEVWNEPDLEYFWAGTMEDYFMLYKNTAGTIKKIDKRLKVGGPATSRNKWVDETLEFCDKNNVSLDFISTHMYSTDIAIDMEGNKNVGYRAQEYMGECVKNTVDKVRNSKFKDIEVHYTEWNVSPAHNDAFGKDSEFNAVFALQTIKDVRGMVDSYAYWTFSDIFEESGPGITPFSGKYGLYNIHGIRKPSYYAFRYLSLMYDNEIILKEKSMRITKSQYDDYRIILWNMPQVESWDFTGGEWELSGKTRDEVLKINGINGEYRVSGYLVDKDHGNSFRKWQSMGSPQYLKKEDVDILKKAASHFCFIDNVIQCNGELILSHKLTTCSVIYYDIKKI